MQIKKTYKRHSLRGKITSIIAATAVVLGTLAIAISLSVYISASKQQYEAMCTGVAQMIANIVPGDEVDAYLAGGSELNSYKATKAELMKLQESFPEVLYMYVYRIENDGCHVVFDLDTPGLEGSPIGTVVEHDPSFLKYRQDLLDGKEISVVVSDDSYGWLMTAYKPIYNSEGVCKAYAGADISMEEVRADWYVYAIRIISLLVGVAIIIVAFVLWFVQQRIVTPINDLAEVTNRFAFDGEDTRGSTAEKLDQLHITTGDEIENLYAAIQKMVGDAKQYIDLIKAQSRDMAEKAQIIQHMQDAIIRTFADMIESRDANTGSHVRHTAGYADVIGKALRNNGCYSEILTDAYLDDLPRSAPLHDVGKIAISDTILNKPGKLSPGEFEMIKTHTVVGRDILEGSISDIESGSYLKQAIEMATYHHERWDGKGYPEGLKGAQIPLSARIMAVADVFDALISRRSYKESMPFEKAVEIIREESGTHFDPAVVDAFLSAVDRIRAVAEDA